MTMRSIITQPISRSPISLEMMCRTTLTKKVVYVITVIASTHTTKPHFGLIFGINFVFDAEFCNKSIVDSDDESDEGPELNMHFRISGTLDGQTLVMTQVLIF